MVALPVSPRLVASTALVVLALANAGLAHGQDAPDPHAACAAPPTYVPAELLERPIPLKQGTGNSRDSVTAATPEAQAFYDQGLNYLESYVWIEASRSFRQALRLDPKMAMAHLGLSYVASGLEDSVGARHHLAQAAALSAGVTERERRRIAIREKQLHAMADIKDTSRFLAYKKAIDDALVANLDDPQLWLLRGNAEEVNASGRGQRGGSASVAFYEQVLRLVPDHASAHHYLVHSYETIGRIDRALEHGERFARLAPAIPHAAHMWAHDLRRVGRVDEAITQFLRTDSLERAWYAAEKFDPALDWHHGHNLDLLASCYEHQGRMKLAEKTLRESAALAPLNAYRGFNLRELPNFLMRRGRHDEALKAARVLVGYEWAQARSVGHALAGQALLRSGKVGEAEKELAAARRELEAVPAMTMGLDPPRAQVEPWVNGLHGELLLRAGKSSEAREVLQRVVRALRAAPGPDAWSQALFRLEDLASTAVAAGDWELASFVADQMLEHDAAYGGSHAAKALVLRHQGDGVGADRELATAKSLWNVADADLVASLGR